VVLRSLLLLLPCAALALALPVVPHWALVALVVVSATWWATAPDHPAGAVALVLVVAWWSVHGVLDWRAPVVAVLLLVAHVAATVAAYGPATLAVDPRVARLWLGRALLALVPMPVAYVALQGLDADLAPSWLWMAAGVLVVVALLVTSRLTQREPE
jgi:hypothetical protein